MKKNLVLSILLIWGIGYSAEKKHSIDVQIDKLVESAQTTAEQVDAIKKGYGLWDKELNAVYQALKRSLEGDTAAIASLKNSQLAWINFRDNEFKLISSIYKKLEGAMYISMEENDRMLIVRARAIELSERLALLQE